MRRSVCSERKTTAMPELGGDSELEYRLNEEDAQVVREDLAQDFVYLRDGVL
jgi:hypothetical protein